MISKTKKIYIETLGCPRNQVDSELFHSIAAGQGYEYTAEANIADILLINTCGFIKDAKEESIDAIMDINLQRKESSKLVVTGCLVKRYEKELKEQLPEVDFFIGLKDYENFSKFLAATLPDKSAKRAKTINYERKLLTPSHYAYLKISDGCNNHCSYCAIPDIRGEVVSDSLTKLTAESVKLAEAGVKELIITAMDICQYGKDLTPKTNIVELLTRLVKIEGIEWIRLLYLHPAGINTDLLHFIKDNPKICPYLDIPLQHINDSLLNSMNRRMTRYETEKLIDTIRTIIPDIALRTSLITGYPGETEDRFKELIAFVEKTEFNKLGVFIYSREEGTPAYSLPDRVHHKTALRRQKELMRVQEKISENLLSELVGKTLPVIIDNYDENEEFKLEGRTRYDAPEIDGTVFIPEGKAARGDIVSVKITDSWEHDLIGEIVPGK